MAFDPNHLLQRSLIIDRNREIAFCRLFVNEMERDVLMPVMLRLVNIDDPRMTLLVPLDWLEDAVLLNKLAKNTILVTHAANPDLPLIGEARKAGYRVAIAADNADSTLGLADFYLVPLASVAHAAPGIVLSGVDTMADFARAQATGCLYFDGRSHLDTPPIIAKPSINPAHATVLELISAVQQEAEPKDIETLFKKDVTLSFKLLRYINSPYFGLSTRVESVRHALAIIGYQQLFKWLSLLAATAGIGASHALTQNAMMRARLMELLGAKTMDKRDQDHLFITGMFSLLDRIMQTPLEQLLQRANLPESVAQALLEHEGKYAHILALARACEGEALPEDQNFANMDLKTVNLAHLEAIEWAAHIASAA